MKLSRLATISLSSFLFVGSLTAYVSTSPNASANPDNFISQNIAQNNVLKTGNFMTVKQEKQTKGQVKIISENGKRYLELSSDFTTAKGPDVQVILHRSNEISVNPSIKDYFTVSMLKSFEGGQRYLIPDYVKLDEFKSVGIWCREFNVTFAFAPLK
jgi:hypothetical protein